MLDMHTTKYPDPVDQLLFEAEVLNAILRTIQGTSEPKSEILAQVSLALGRRESPEDLTEALSQAAMEKIVGKIAKPVIHRSSTAFFDHWLAEDTAILWMKWITGEEINGAIDSDAEKLPVESSIHETTLRYWRDAVVKLAQGATQESMRLWKRAMELGSQFGTESHVLVSWSYAASFFTSGEPHEGSDLPS